MEHTIIDSHSHIYLDDFKEDIGDVIQRAKSENISAIYMPNIDEDSVEAMLKVETENKGFCHAMMGLHPCSVQDDWQRQLDVLEAYWNDRTFAAVGEIGLDLYWRKDNLEQQSEALLRQFQFAILKNKPVSIHSRESTAEVIELIQKNKLEDLKGVFHCFSGSLDEAKEVIKMGFFLGIGGALTYKKSDLDLLLKEIDIKHLVLETDAPYLAPVPFRGKRNEPSYLKNVVQKLEEVYSLSFAEICSITTENSKRLFENYGF